jgi:hypothetical protein
MTKPENSFSAITYFQSEQGIATLLCAGFVPRFVQNFRRGQDSS